ncbi:MAG: tetratricopeptide repeat protein, partial [Alphaproteobacteria bacterium]|nr:tetratricopeptide repeat protein [Alphaproteobacteria bacterium]
SLGNAERLDGRPVAARQRYEQARNLNPQKSEAWYGLGVINTAREEVKAGRVNLDAAIRRLPDGPGYQGELGLLETFADSFDEARQAYQRALSHDPNDYVALTGLGLLELKQGNTACALRQFIRATLMEPSYARARLYTAITYYQLGRRERAITEMREAAALDEKDPLPWFYLAMIYNDLLRPAEAIEASQRALQLLPNLKSLNQVKTNAQGNANVGQSIAGAGMESWAASYAQRSANPYWAGSHLFLADRYQGNFTKNSELFQGFLTDPTVFGASNRFNTLLPSPVTNLSTSQRYANGDLFGDAYAPNFSFSGFNNEHRPTAWFYEREKFEFSEFNGGGPSIRRSNTGAVGTKLNHDLGMFIFADDITLNGLDQGVPGVFEYDEAANTRRIDGGLNYKINPFSQLWFKVSYIGIDYDIGDGELQGGPVDFRSFTDQNEYGFRHTLDCGEEHQVTWGADYSTRRGRDRFFSSLDIPSSPFAIESEFLITQPQSTWDVYFADRWQVKDNLLLDAGIFYQAPD